MTDDIDQLRKRAGPRPPEISDADYHEYVLFWNAINNAIIDAITRKELHHNPNSYPEGHEAWIPASWRDEIIGKAWMQIAESRRAFCDHSPGFGGTCIMCGYVVFTRDEKGNRVT